MRAHYRAPVQDNDGNLLAGTVVSVFANGTTSLLTEPIFADGTSSDVLGNPFATDDGNVSFYLAAPERVDLGIQPPGLTQAIITDIDVEVASSASVSLTFPGAGTSSTQVGASAAANGNQATAFGVSAIASGTNDTALGEAATASGGSSLAVGEGAVASGFSSTVVGQGATTSGGAANGTALGQGAGASDTQTTALGSGAGASAAGATSAGYQASAGSVNSTAIGSSAQAAASHSTALGAGAQATSPNQIVLGTANDDVIIPGGLVWSQSSSPTVLATGGTLTFTGPAQVTVAPTANVTGIILALGTVAGQVLTIINESAFTVTFAAAGTSHVADGTSDVIAATTARKFVWDANTSLWYRLA